MERRGFMLQVRPEDREEYIERHKAVYPELLQAFREVGIRTYSIFFHEGQLFAYMEVENFERAMRLLKDHPANQRWQQFMSDLLINVDDQGNKQKDIEEVFHFEV